MSTKVSWKQKVDAVTSGSTIDQSSSIAIITRNIKVWLISTFVLGFYALTKRQPKFDRADSNNWYFYTSSVFGIGVFFSFLAIASAKSPEKRALSKVLCYCNLIAMATYLLSATRLTHALPDVNGYPVEVGRYLEWVCTCPVLILLIGEITKCPEIASKTMSYDYIMLGFGFVGSITREPFSYFFLMCCLSYFSLIIYGLNEMFDLAIEGKTGCTLDVAALTAAKYATLFAWNAFTAIWFMVRYQVIPFATGEMLFGFADIIAKVLLTLVLVNATVESSQNEKVNALSTIAQEMENELNSSDALLQRMMPQEVIDQIKAGKATEAEEYQCVTVFFSDITNFTVLSSQTSTKEMLNTLNLLWMEYDKIAKKWGMYKVETIGDAYLGVIGCPERIPDHAEKAVQFSIDIIEMIKGFKTAMGSSIAIRVGLNSGPITAGVLGEMNPHWCIVGDTVNTASRMESTSKPMHIHISESTKDLVEKCGKFVISEPEILNVKVCYILTRVKAQWLPSGSTAEKLELEINFPSTIK